MIRQQVFINLWVVIQIKVAAASGLILNKIAKDGTNSDEEHIKKSIA